MKEKPFDFREDKTRACGGSGGGGDKRKKTIEVETEKTPLHETDEIGK